MHRKLWHTRRIWIHMMAWETWKPCRWFGSGVAVAPVKGLAPSRWWLDVYTKMLHITTKFWVMRCFFESASNCYHVLRNLSDTCKKFSGFLENDRFKGEKVTRQIFMLARVTSIKQIRVFVGSILQPRYETHKNRPRPKTIQTEKRWSYSNFTIRSPLRYFLQG